MGRYSSTKINKKKKGSSYQYNNRKAKSLTYNTTIYSDVPEKDTDTYVITQTGDRLDNLATTFYGSPRHWWFISHVNNLDKMNVEAGITLRIPSSLENAQGK